MAINEDRDRVWAAAERLSTRAASAEDLRWHRLHLIGAAAMRAGGREVPERLLAEERLAALGAVTAAHVLRLVRNALDGPVLLMKGPEVAARYPDPALRPLHDVDLIVADAGAAHARLLAAGFEVVDDDEPDDPALHHRAALVRPGLPLIVELHDRPKWPERLPAPSAAELLATGRPSVVGIDGLLAPPPAEHAVLLAAHSWAHQPLRRALDLVDVALLAAETAPGEPEAVARRWGCEQLWRTTARAATALLRDGPTPWPMRIWARDLTAVSRRTTLALHLEHWTAPLGAEALRPGAHACLAALRRDLRPGPGETWREKLRRTRASARHSFLPHAEHARRIGKPIRGWDPRA